MTPFAVLARAEAPAHEELALSLAAELGCPAGSAPARLDALAARVRREGDPRHDLETVRALVAGLDPSPDGALLLPIALTGRGHPAVVAVIAAAVAARAGREVEPVGTRDGRLLLAHRAALDPPFVIDPSGPAHLVDARMLETDLAWRCAHETALCLLDAIVARAIRSNDLSTALAASALRLALPLDELGHARVAEAHAKLLARLN